MNVVVHSTRLRRGLHHPGRGRRGVRLRVLAQLLITLLVGLAAVLPALAHSQEQAPVTLDVQAGYGGRFRISQWFPVSVTVSNDGPDLRGVLEWRFPGQTSGMRFQREVDLPRGARKRLTLAVYSNDFVRTGELRLLSDDAEVALQQLRLEPVDPGQLLVGVISGDDALLASLGAMRFNNVSGVNVLRMQPEVLPDQALALSGLDVLFIHDAATANLTPEQRAALELWVRLGGQLIVGGGANAERTVPGVAELLPASPVELVGDVELGSLAALAGLAPGGLPATTVNRVTPGPTATALDGDQLITARDYGSGRVIFAAFDLAALRAWPGEPELWAAVIESGPRLDSAAAYRWQGDNILRDALQLPALRLPPIWVLLLFLVVYITVVGPLNFYLLRRRGRVDLAWITIPAIVTVFVAGTYGAGFLLRGTRPQITQAAIVQGFEGAPRGAATAFLGIFSPRRGSYNLVFPAETLVSTGRLDGSNGQENTTQRWADSATVIDDVLVDVSALRSFVVEGATGAVPAVQSALQRAGQRVQGEVQNTGATQLLDAMLVSGKNMQPLGTLQPGERRQVDLLGTENNFPDGANAADEGLFDRQTILDSLFTPNQFAFGGPVAPNFQPVQGLPDDGGVYLLAWGTEPAVAIQINGAAATQQGLTLYLIRLDV